MGRREVWNIEKEGGDDQKKTKDGKERERIEEFERLGKY
jgi:hypothetical protein